MECKKCPRHCNTKIDAGILGFCSASRQVKLGLVSLHKWEEPCISGTNGSGTIFFSGCNLRCCFCQNYKISQLGFGKEVSTDRLAEIMIELQAKHAHNINLVTPTHYAYQIIDAIHSAKAAGLHIPILYNTNSYETVQTIQSLSASIDVYLPDIKYYNSNLSQKYSLAPHYFYHAVHAVEEMVFQTGAPAFDEHGLITKGVIVRHLILPGCSEDSKKILKHLYTHFGNAIYISLMNQFTPLHQCSMYPELNRQITSKEYSEVLDYALTLGFKNGYIQQGETSSSAYIPDFNLNGVDPI